CRVLVRDHQVDDRDLECGGDGVELVQIERGHAVETAQESGPRDVRLACDPQRGLPSGLDGFGDLLRRGCAGIHMDNVHDRTGTATPYSAVTYVALRMPGIQSGTRVIRMTTDSGINQAAAAVLRGELAALDWT